MQVKFKPELGSTSAGASDGTAGSFAIGTDEPPLMSGRTKNIYLGSRVVKGFLGGRDHATGHRHADRSADVEQ